MTLHAVESAQPLVVLREGSRSFHFASRFLAAEVRDDAALLYAFCRWVDDLADDAPSPEEGRAALAQVTAELTGAAPARPFVTQVLDLFCRCHIDVRHALELIRGVDSDLDEVRLDSDAELVVYGYRVAGTVGLMMCGVLGVRDPVAAPFAIDLGVGMQITNICRDVLEDARNGRVYLPARRLVRFGIDASPEAVLRSPEAATAVVSDLLEMADRYYESGLRGLRYLPWTARTAILVAARVYQAIGHRLLRKGGNPLQGRTVVPWWAKVGVAAASLARLALFGSGRPAEHLAALHRPLAGLPGAHS